MGNLTEAVCGRGYDTAFFRFINMKIQEIAAIYKNIDDHKLKEDHAYQQAHTLQPKSRVVGSIGIHDRKLQIGDNICDHCCQHQGSYDRFTLSFSDIIRSIGADHAEPHRDKGEDRNAGGSGQAEQLGIGNGHDPKKAHENTGVKRHLQ